MTLVQEEPEIETVRNPEGKVDLTHSTSSIMDDDIDPSPNDVRPGGVWTVDELMWGKDENRYTGDKANRKVDPLDWGLPGYLTQQEVDVFVKFREEVYKRGGHFRETVYAFTEVEGEAYTLTRWLRARKFVYEDVITMVEEATACRDDPRKQKYYPDPEIALGVHPSVYINQYPQLYPCFAKNGCPVYISKPGSLDIDAVECITSLEGILKFHWHIMQHDYTNRLLKHKEEYPKFERFENVSVLDLENLTASKLNKRTLEIIKKQTVIDSLCFPETMNRMLIVNAPYFFNVTWTIIKRWIDPRTTGKIEMFSNKSSMMKRMRELVDEDQLPSDYGGKAKSTDHLMNMELPREMVRLESKVLYVKYKESYTLELMPGEEADVKIYTRGTKGAKFTIYDSDKNPLIQETEVIHHGSEDDEFEMPTNVQLTPIRIKGPKMLKIKAESDSRKVENFLLVCFVYPSTN